MSVESILKPTRVPVSQKTRFEVFKRDKFACQYCGASAPEVVLNCDHITPVAEGGLSDILNLITSCKSCNGGKGKILLSDSTALDKQHRMLVELEERQQQLKMMIEWRDSLNDIDGETVQYFVGVVSRNGYRPNDIGRDKILKWVKKYPLDVLVRAADEAFDAYSAGGLEGWGRAFNAIPKFARMIEEEVECPDIRKLLYIQGIIRNRFDVPVIIDYLKCARSGGATLASLERFAMSSKDLTEFMDRFDRFAGS